MLPRRSRNLEPVLVRIALLMAMLVLLLLPARAAETILILKNGDRLAGQIVSEDGTNLVVNTSWTTNLLVPVAAIGQRQVVATMTNVPPAPPVVVAASNPSPKPAPKPAPPQRHLKSKFMFGADALWGARDRQLYYSRVNLAYHRPYKKHPEQAMNTMLDYRVDYGETDGVTSANRMDGLLKTDFDVSRRHYLYAGGGAGFDEVKKIDFRYEAGPGVGYRVFTNPKFSLNIEAGGNYEEQQRSLGESESSIYARAGQDLSWKIGDRVTLTEKFEFFNDMDETDQFRFRLDSTLSFAVWKNVSLNLTLLDLYDTSPAPTVDRNELQLRSSLGLAF